MDIKEPTGTPSTAPVMPAKIRLHDGERTTKAATMQDLYGEMSKWHAAVRANGIDTIGMDFFPVELPWVEDPENPDEEVIAMRFEIREKLAQLLVGSFVAFKAGDGQSIVRDYVPNPGMRSTAQFFDRDDMDTMLAQPLERLLDPRDRHFDNAVADINHGAIAAMGAVVNFAIDLGDPKAAAKYWQRLSRQVDGKDVTELPWDGDDEKAEGQEGVVTRTKVFDARMKTMEASGYRTENDQLIAKLMSGPFKKFQNFFNGIMQQLGSAMNGFGCTDYQTAKWVNVFLSNLNICFFAAGGSELSEEKMSVVMAALSAFMVKLSRAAKRNDIAACIDAFVKEDLPKLKAVPASKAKEANGKPQNGTSSIH